MKTGLGLHGARSVWGAGACSGFQTDCCQKRRQAAALQTPRGVRAGLQSQVRLRAAGGATNDEDGMATAGAKRLGLRQSSGAFGRALVGKAAEDCRTPKRRAVSEPVCSPRSGFAPQVAPQTMKTGWRRLARGVLGCASPLALSVAHWWEKQQRTAALQNASRGPSRRAFFLISTS